MALKEEIQKVFEDSVGGESDNIEKLAEGLSIAIERFITKQTFRVDKLNMTHKGLETLPIPPITRDVTGVVPLITTAIGAPIMPYKYLLERFQSFQWVLIKMVVKVIIQDKMVKLNLTYQKSDLEKMR